MKREIKFLLASLLLIFVAACGSGGSTSSTPSTPADTYIPPGNYTPGVHLLSGDNQSGPIGSALLEPLSVVVYDATGNPANAKVQFTITSGAGMLSSTTTWTNINGIASVNLTLGGDVDAVKVNATVYDLGSATFTETPRLPTLEEVIDSTLDGAPVAFFPALLATLDNGQEALVLLKGEDPTMNTDNLPMAGELLGGEIGGIPAEDYPVIFLPASALIGTTPISALPTGSELLARYIAPLSADDLPVVVDLLVNGGPAVVGILGDASGITLDTLGALIIAGAVVDYDGVSTPVADLPVYLVRVEDFPPDPSLDDNCYIAMSLKKMPIFSALDTVGGSSSAIWITRASATLTTTSPMLVSLVDGIASRGVLLYNTAPLVDVAAPETSLTPLPVEFLGVFNVVDDQIVPLMEEAQPTMDEMQTNFQKLGQISLDNQDLFESLIAGDISDPLALASLAADLLPVIDDLVGSFLDMLDNIEQQLIIVENDLLPAILAALPADGGAFGGYSDGQPSTIADDIIPLIQDQIDLFQAALPTIQQLLQDIESLIPDDGSILALIANVLGGGIDDILSDIENLVPYIADGIQIFDDQGIPILYDILEEAGQQYLPGASPVSETPIFQTIVASLEAALPPDTTLSDLPGFDMIGPILGNILPPEWGDPADVSLFDVIIPAIGSTDIGAEILPVMQDGVDALDAALPEIIDALNNLDLSGLEIPFL